MPNAISSNGRARKGLRLLIPVLLILLVAGLAACGAGAEPPGVTVADEAASITDNVAELAEEATEPDDAEIDAEEEAVEEEPAAAGSAEADEAAAGMQTFTITSDGTEARFLIDEVLMGNDKTVVGVTSDVTGEISLDPTNPSASQIGDITINARDLTTDEERRNGAIRRFVLQTEQDANQYIVFTPTAIDGMPDTVSVGEPFSFQVTGDLKIRDVVRQETFDVEVTANSESEISGLASTQVLYKDYGLIIPEVPAVTSVEDEVILEFEFTAVAG